MFYLSEMCWLGIYIPYRYMHSLDILRHNSRLVGIESQRLVINNNLNSQLHAGLF